MNGRNAADRARAKTLGGKAESQAGAAATDGGSAAGPHSQQQSLPHSGASSAYLTQDNVNLEATQKYIQILEEKIREYNRSLLEVQMLRESQTSRAIEELNNYDRDQARQEHTKRRLQREQGEFTTRTQNIQRNMQKLEYKLKELRAHGIPKQVVPDDYVRQLKKKDAKKRGRAALLQPMANLLKQKTASSGDLLLTGGGAGGSDATTIGKAASPQKKSQSLEHDAVPPLPPPSLQHANPDSDRLTVSSSEPTAAGGGKATSLSDEDSSRFKAPVAFVLGVGSGGGGGGGGPRSTVSRSNVPKSRVSSLSSDDQSAARAPASRTSGPPAPGNERSRQRDDSAAAASSVTGASATCDRTETLRAHFDHVLEEQRRTLSADLDTVRNRLQEEAGDIHKLVDTEIHKLRYDQQELSASLDDNQKELEKMKVFLTNLSKEIGKLMLVDQQIDEINNKIAVLSRDLQGPGGTCPHGRPDSAATSGTRLLNLLVAMLSYGFVAVSCLINVFLWMLGLLRSRPFVIVCLVVLLLALLLRQWPLPPGSSFTSDGLAALLARHCPLAVRRFLADLALALNNASSTAAAADPVADPGGGGGSAT